MTSAKVAEAYLESLVANLALLESAKAQVTDEDVKRLIQLEPPKLPDTKRAQLIYYVAVLAEGANNILGTSEKPGLAPTWFQGEEVAVIRALVSLRNTMLHGYLNSADDRIFWNALNSSNYQAFHSAVSRLARQYL
jgi:hypothetical protein